MTTACAVRFAEAFAAVGASPDATWTIGRDQILASVHGPALTGGELIVAPGLALADVLRGHRHAARALEAHRCALDGLAGGYVIEWGALWLRVHVSPTWDSRGQVTGAFGVAHRTTAEAEDAGGWWGVRTEEEIRATLTCEGPYQLPSGRVLPAGTDVVFRPGRGSKEVVALTTLSAEEATDVVASPVFAVSLARPAALVFSIRETLASLLRQRDRPRLGLVK